MSVRTAHDRFEGVPATPPPEVRASMGAAGARARAWADEDRELHFEADPVTGRVVVQVRDLDGAVLRTLSPSEALSVAAGRVAL